MSCCEENTFDFDLYQDTTFDSIVFQYILKATGEPIPLTGYTTKMSIQPYAGGADIISILSTTAAPASRMIQDDSEGTTQPYITYGDMDSGDFPVGKYRYDVIAYTSTEVIRLIGGVITVLEAVTVKA